MFYERKQASYIITDLQNIGNAHIFVNDEKGNVSMTKQGVKMQILACS